MTPTRILLKIVDLIWAIADAIRAVARLVDWIGDLVNASGHRLLDAWGFLTERVPLTVRLWTSLARPMLNLIVTAIRLHRRIWAER